MHIRFVCKSIYRHLKFFPVILILIYFFVFSKYVHEELNNYAILSNDLMWMEKHRNLSEFVKMNINGKTCLICPERPICRRKITDFVVFVISHPDNFLQRNAIRETWAKDVIIGTANRPIFITGIIDDIDVMASLSVEGKYYDDILTEDFLDSYVNLTIKTAYILKNFVELCPYADYLIKVDDDGYINIKKILNTIQMYKNFLDKPIIGRMIENGSPYRTPNEKWYLPFELYNERRFPNFISGPGYLIPGMHVNNILKRALIEPMINLEDVFFTGMIAEKLNITRSIDRSFLSFKPTLHHICIYKDATLVSSLTAADIMEIGVALQKTDALYCNSSLYYKFIKYILMLP